MHSINFNENHSISKGDELYLKLIRYITDTQYFLYF